MDTTENSGLPLLGYGEGRSNWGVNGINRALGMIDRSLDSVVEVVGKPDPLSRVLLVDSDFMLDNTVRWYVVSNVAISPVIATSGSSSVTVYGLETCFLVHDGLSLHRLGKDNGAKEEIVTYPTLAGDVDLNESPASVPGTSGFTSGRTESGSTVIINGDPEEGATGITRVTLPDYFVKGESVIILNNGSGDVIVTSDTHPVGPSPGQPGQTTPGVATSLLVVGTPISISSPPPFQVGDFGNFNIDGVNIRFVYASIPLPANTPGVYYLALPASAFVAAGQIAYIQAILQSNSPANLLTFSIDGSFRVNLAANEFGHTITLSGAVFPAINLPVGTFADTPAGGGKSLDAGRSVRYVFNGSIWIGLEN